MDFDEVYKVDGGIVAAAFTSALREGSIRCFLLEGDLELAYQGQAELAFLLHECD